jgi:hypothetical protein
MWLGISNKVFSKFLTQLKATIRKNNLHILVEPLLDAMVGFPTRPNTTTNLFFILRISNYVI